jgi:hypothetical protein
VFNTFAISIKEAGPSNLKRPKTHQFLITVGMSALYGKKSAGGKIQYLVTALKSGKIDGAVKTAAMNMHISDSLSLHLMKAKRS